MRSVVKTRLARAQRRKRDVWKGPELMRHVYVDIEFSPSADLISHVRRFVERFYESFVAETGADAAARIALTTHELLENAVKYGSDGITNLRIELGDPTSDGRELEIRVRNRATPEHLEKLRESIAEMSQFSDVDEYYRHVVTRSAKVRGTSGLGLPRILAEAGMKLRVDNSPDGTIVVCARTVLGKEAA